jgi:hypothetical protein
MGSGEEAFVLSPRTVQPTLPLKDESIGGTPMILPPPVKGPSMGEAPSPSQGPFLPEAPSVWANPLTGKKATLPGRRSGHVPDQKGDHGPDQKGWEDHGRSAHGLVPEAKQAVVAGPREGPSDQKGWDPERGLLVGDHGRSANALVPDWGNFDLPGFAADVKYGAALARLRKARNELCSSQQMVAKQRAALRLLEAELLHVQADLAALKIVAGEQHMRLGRMHQRLGRMECARDAAQSRLRCIRCPNERGIVFNCGHVICCSLCAQREQTCPYRDCETAITTRQSVMF